MIRDAISSALRGIFSGISRVEAAAKRVSEGSLEAKDMVDVVLGRHEVSANRAVLSAVSETEDEVIRILDRKA